MKKYKDLKKATERVQIEVPSDYEEDANEFITKASAAHRAGKDKFMIGGKVYPVTIKKPVKTEAKDPPFTPDPPRKNPPARAGKYGLGPSVAKHLAKKGMSGETKKEDMYSADMQVGKDDKMHPRHRINFHNSGTDAEREKQKDEKEKAKKRGDKMEESMARKALSRMMQDKSNVKNVRIPSPAERRAEMEKQKQMKKEEVNPDQKEYDYEGDMAKNQLARIMMHSKHFMEMLQDDTNLPEWVQSKITKAEDYISSAHDYMMGEMQNEEVKLDEVDMGQAERGMRGQSKPTGRGYRVVNMKTRKNISTHDSQSDAMRVATRNDDYKVDRIKESIEEKMNLAKTDMGDVIKDFQKSDAPQFKGKSKEKKREMAIAAKLGAEREAGMREEKEVISFTEYLKEYEYDKGRPGVVTHKGSYGTSYNSDDKDAPKKTAEPAVKRGRGRPVGSKSGANTKVTAKKSYGGIAHHTLNLPNSNR